MTLLDHLLIAILGLMVGSFMAVVIARSQALLCTGDTPAERFPLLWPASHCPHCEIRLRWFELIPLLSALCLRWRCRSCQQHIGWRDTAVELSTLALTLTLLCFDLLWPWLMFFAWLMVLAWIDAETQMLPDVLTLSLLWLGLLSASLGWLAIDPMASIWGALLGYLILWCVAQGYWWWCRQDGLGGGDLKLLAALGAWLGWQALPWILYGAASSGLIFVLLRGWQRRTEPIAFGPALVFGATLYWLFTMGVEAKNLWVLLWV